LKHYASPAFWTRYRALPGATKKQAEKNFSLLKADTGFTPFQIHDGDELFPNGIFEFNVTRILEYLDNNPTDIDIVEIGVNDLDQGFSSLDGSHVQSADISRPVILVEISPGHYNLIDGHHRVERARQLGVSTIRAYKFSVLQHINFLTSNKAYLSYIEYWNGKVKQFRQTEKAEQERCTATR